MISFEHVAARQLYAAYGDLLPLAVKFAILGNGDLKQIEALPRNSAITYAVMHRDGVGEARNPRVVLEEILQRAKVPVFVNHSTLLITGVVGGHTLDTDKVAKLMRVLYAEDQKTLQMLTTALLKKQGAQVVLANDGAEALELFETQDFDFVLTDIMMPNLDGYGLTQALRKNGYRNKIIGLTAATIGLETDQLLAAGADATLSKPVDINTLVGLVTATADSL